MFEVDEKPIDMAELVRAVENPGAGAIVTFAGVTRNESHGKPVESLAYEAYAEMARTELEKIARQAKERYEVKAVAIRHRTGLLGIGEISVGIAVAAAHRPAAFEACRFAIEAVKKDVPIWKRERFADGTEEWVHPGCC